MSKEEKSVCENIESVGRILFKLVERMQFFLVSFRTHLKYEKSSHHEYFIFLEIPCSQNLYSEIFFRQNKIVLKLWNH